MMGDPSDLGERSELHDGNLPLDIPETRLFSYYRDDNEETGGMKVKWTVRVTEGAEAAELDARQNHAIWELLQWAHRYLQDQDSRQAGPPGSPSPS